MDIIYIGFLAIFSLLTWGLIKLCEVLGDKPSGGKS